MKNRPVAICIAICFAAATALGCKPSSSAPSQGSEAAGAQGEMIKIVVGHLVGVCAASLVLADRLGYFKEEGLDVELRWTPNPGDAMAQLGAGAIQIWNGSFTAVYRAAEEGLSAKIVAGAGIEGVSILASKKSGLKTMDDLVARKKTGLKVGTQRLNTIEMTMYSALFDRGLGYEDLDMKFFPDHFTMSATFVNGDIDVVSHIEPYASQLEIEQGAVVLARSADTWGPGSPECVTTVRADFLKTHRDAVKRYIRALLRADAFIKANREKALDVLEASKVWKVNRQELAQSLAHQQPGVDLTKNYKQMDRGLQDMKRLGYLRSDPKDLVDLTLLAEVNGAAR